MTDQVAPEVIAEARAWAEAGGYTSLLGDEVVEARDMTDEEVLALTDRQYPGGAEGFSRDAGGGDDGHVSMAPHGQWAT